MNNKFSIVLFIVAFFVSYLIICFGIPGMRIKLQAEPMVYFVKSIKHMILIKTIISFIVGLIAGMLPKIIAKRN